MKFLYIYIGSVDQTRWIRRMISAQLFAIKFNHIYECTQRHLDCSITDKTQQGVITLSRLVAFAQGINNTHGCIYFNAQILQKSVMGY